MSKIILRASYGILLFLMTALCQAGVLEVTAPTDGAFVGRTNTINFIVRGASVQVTVKAVVTGPGGSTTIQQQFTPDAEGEISSTLPLNFSASNPEGAYTIVVTATEPGNSYNTVTINVTLDTTSPKFLEFNPLPGSFVKGIVPISVRVNEPNVKEMRVQVNDQDIPNNSTDQDTITVMWDTSGIEEDGEQTIKVKVTDEANNESSKTIEITLDRVKPIVTIQYPRTDTMLRKGGEIPVVVDIVDTLPSAISPFGVDVIVQQMNGAFITRSAVANIRNSGPKLTWSGRIRWQKNLPSKFKIVVNAVDKAGNVATTQEVVVTIR